MHHGLVGHREDIISIDDKIRELDEKRKSMHQCIQCIDERHGGYATEVDAMAAGLRDHKKVIETLHTGVCDHKTKIQNLHDDMSKQKVDVERMNNNMGEFDTMRVGLLGHTKDIKDMHIGLCDQKMHIQKIGNALDDAQCGLSTHKTCLETIGAGVAEQKRAVVSLDRDFAALRETGLNTRDDIRRLNDGLILQKQSIENLQKEALLMTRSRTNCVGDADLQELRNSLSSQQNTLQKMQEYMNTLNTTHASAKPDISQVKQGLLMQRDAMESLCTTNQQECADVKRNLASIVTRLGELERQNSQRV